MKCAKCHRPMEGSMPYDGACGCGGLIVEDEQFKSVREMYRNNADRIDGYDRDDLGESPDY